jgi:hypothetical protein
MANRTRRPTGRCSGQSRRRPAGSLSRLPLNGVNVSQTRFMRTAFFVATAIFVMACDPGLAYRIPGARIQSDRFRHYVIEGGNGIDAGFSAGVFIFGGHLDVQITNRSTGPITFDGAPTEIRDAKGAVVPSECRLPTGSVVIERGEMFQVSCTFRMKPKGRKFYDPESYVLIISQPGFCKDGEKLNITAAMTAYGD